MASGPVENGEIDASMGLSSSATSVTTSSTSSNRNSNSTSITTNTTNAYASSPLSPVTPSTPTFSSATPLMAAQTPRVPMGSMRSSRRFRNTDSIASTSAGSVRRPWIHSESGLPSPSRCSSQFFDDGPSPYDLADLEAPRPLFAARSVSDRSSIVSSSRFSLLPDPSTWGSAMHTDIAEPDDDLHTPDPNRDETIDKGGTVFTPRGILNLGCLIVLVAALFALFIGIPFLYNFSYTPAARIRSSLKVNSTGQVPIRALRRFVLDDLER